MHWWQWLGLGMIWSDTWQEAEEEVRREREQSYIPDFTPRQQNAVGSVIVKVEVERLSTVEERLGVKLAGVTAEYDKDYPHEVIVRGELTAATGDKLKHDVDVITTVYDASGDVIGTECATLFCGKFSVSEPFMIHVGCSRSHGQPSRMKIFPREAS